MTQETLMVFVSDCHIGGDPGCDSFEASEELGSLFEELTRYKCPVELVLAGDFFDLLLIGDPPEGTDRVGLTIGRPEYQTMFGALRRFAAVESHRVIYLPGNHDSEVWWNPGLRNTLREAELVSEFALYYAASVEGPKERRFTVYCEHGDQFDPISRVEDYSSPLSTPLAHHVVSDFERRIVPLGKIAWILDVSEMKNVHPTGAMPQWVASKYFYNAMGRAITYLMIPFVLSYLAYRALAFYSSVSDDLPRVFYDTYLLIPEVNRVIRDISFFVFITLLLFGALFLILKRTLQRVTSVIATDPRVRTRSTQRQHIEAMVRERDAPPMSREEVPAIDAFVSGHSHAPGVRVLKRVDGGQAVVANCGCWLREFTPVRARFKGPSVFVSRFVLTHVRIFRRGAGLRVELWGHPKPVAQRLTRVERLVSWGRIPRQPPAGAKPRVIAASEIPA